MDDIRKNIRYGAGALEHFDVHVETASDPVMVGILCDISAGGMCLQFEVSDWKLFEGMDDFFIRLVVGDRSVLAGVKKTWESLKETADSVVCSIGVKFNIVSPDDRLKLDRIIELLRSGGTVL